MKPRLLPSLFRPKILTEADLDNHPMATAYIDYLEHSRFPLSFQEWIDKQARQAIHEDQRTRDKLAAIAVDPYCRSPIKRRRIK